jgi:homoserine dehydrogenase
MRIQLIGLGHVGQSLIELIEEKKELLTRSGLDPSIVSVSDSEGTATDKAGLDTADLLKYKKLSWKGFRKYVKGYGALDAIREIESDIVVELTPSTFNGEPGLSNIRTALTARKNVVTSNKGPLVVAYKQLTKMARENGVKLLYEATVGAHVPVFCLAESCFKADKLQNVRGILNATTNFVLGEMQKGKTFERAIDEAVKAGWAETDYSDDVDGIDAARKLVIMANTFFDANAKLGNVKVEGIRHIEPLVDEARRRKRRIKLVCEIKRGEHELAMSVSPLIVASDDQLATVNQGDMAVRFTFETSKEIFVSARFLGPRQTAYAVLNDMAKTNQKQAC